MTLFHRKTFTGIGVAAAVIASTALFSSPAQAASAGAAKVVGSSTVQFNALLGKSNGLVITISGRTVTLNDKVAIKAGKGCKAVKGDKTKVKCTTSKKTTKLSVALGDKNDYVTNKTSVYMLADGGSGVDTLTGGSGKDQLQGGSSNDKLVGNNGNDTFFGGTGNDTITGGNGNDELDGESGNDTLRGGPGNDKVYGDSGNDTLYGDSGNDTVLGETGNDKIYGWTGDDTLDGWTGNDTIVADAGADEVFAGAGNDTVNAGADDDFVLGEGGNDTILGAGGDDGLIGEDFILLDDDTIQPVGSDTATDVLDGGSQSVDGDFCLVMAAGTTVNCENELAPATALGLKAKRAAISAERSAVSARAGR